METPGFSFRRSWSRNPQIHQESISLFSSISWAGFLLCGVSFLAQFPHMLRESQRLQALITLKFVTLKEERWLLVTQLIQQKNSNWSLLRLSRVSLWLGDGVLSLVHWISCLSVTWLTVSQDFFGRGREQFPKQEAQTDKISCPLLDSISLCHCCYCCF